MPRERKPTEQRRNRGTKDIGTVRPREGLVPQAPRDWKESTRKAWRNFWESSVASVIDPKSDMAAIIRLFSMYEEREALVPLMQSAPLVKGSQGQLRLNPLGARIDQLDASITALEDRFGMSPKARLSTGMQIEKEPSKTTKPSESHYSHLRAVGETPRCHDNPNAPASFRRSGGWYSIEAARTTIPSRSQGESS